MMKKELREEVERVYDEAVINGSAKFSNAMYHEDISIISISKVSGEGLLGMRLKFEDASLALYTSRYNRKEMIIIFTEFLWLMEL